MWRFGFTLIITLSIYNHSYSQSKLNQFLRPSDTLNYKRQRAVYISEAVVGGLTLSALHQLWYADYNRSDFHAFNDNNEWLQMDKLGHVFSSYQLGKVGANLLNWSGASQKEQLVYGATLGLSFLTAVEVLDGFSQEWGFSWGDILANGIGAGFYVGQELLWDEQRVLLKYSFHRTNYAVLNPEKLGNGFMEELLKDYNGQTYWLSFNLYSFLKNEHIPQWLNLAIGYGADGMMFAKGGIENNFKPLAHRQRQFYLSMDIDLSRIKTKSQVVRTIFDVLNVIKLPLPALEFTAKNDVRLHGIYY